MVRPRRAVVGLEAEFSVVVNDRKCRPEHVFRTPRALVRDEMLPRGGRSCHLPSGGAIYFDTGVIEVATPIIEIESACAVRAARSLWDQIAYVREELNAWEKLHCNVTRLEGFSAHYNITITCPGAGDAAAERCLALLLTYILHAPMMLLAANRLSTGIGVRPRGGRVELTADFTPDPDLMTAAAAAGIGIAMAVQRWPDHRLRALDTHRIPVIAGFRPCRHTSRKGFLARFDCFPRNPFATGVNEPVWLLRDGRTVSLRHIAREITVLFASEIRHVADADSFEHVFAVLDGRARSLLDFPGRPPRYEDVGRVIDWRRRSIRALPHSRYERVIHRIITGRPLRIGEDCWMAERMQGWYEIVFRNVRTRRRRVFNLDDLVAHCGR